MLLCVLYYDDRLPNHAERLHDYGIHQSDALPTELVLVADPRKRKGGFKINKRAVRTFLGVTPTSGHTLSSKTIGKSHAFSVRVSPIIDLCRAS